MIAAPAAIVDTESASSKKGRPMDVVLTLGFWGLFFVGGWLLGRRSRS